MFPAANKPTPRESGQPLIYLPRKPTREVRRGEAIYDPARPSHGVHFIIHGMVKVCRNVREHPTIAMEIFSADEFLGESSLLSRPALSETALPLEDTSLMSWTAEEIEQQIEKQPELGLAFIHVLTR